MSAKLLNAEIHRFKEVPSTNLVAKDLAKSGSGAGTAVIASSQTQGKGRGKKTWASPEGGLYCSYLLKATDLRRLADLSLVAGVAVCQTVRELLPKHFEVSLKWPNDVLIGKKKVAGILCESSGEDPALCVVGIGINVNTAEKELAPFAENPFPATSFLTEFGATPLDLEKIFTILTRKLFGMYQIYQNEGFETVRHVWERNCSFLNKRIEFTENGDGKAPGTVKLVGQFLGIDANGALVLATNEGEKRFYSGEITCFWP